MAQQINLLDPALQPRRDWLDAGHGLALVGLILCACAALSAALQWQARHAVALPAALPAPPAATAANSSNVSDPPVSSINLSSELPPASCARFELLAY